MEKEINKRIRKYRKDAHLTQEKTANALGIKCSTYSQMERKGNIRADIAIKLADIFKVDPDFIIYGSKPLDFTPIEPKVLTANAPDTFAQKLQEEFPLKNREKQAITIIRNLSEEDREEVYSFIEEKQNNRMKKTPHKKQTI